MGKNNNFPEIRFQGFLGEWDRNKLGEVAIFSKGQGYSKGDIRDKGTPIILYGRLYTNYQAIIDEIDTYVSPKTDSVYSNGCEVIVPASGETAEDIARASAVISTGVLLGGDLNIIYPPNIINSIFLALNISNGRPQRELAKRAQGKSVVHLRNNDLKEITIVYPSTSEQTKIGTYFKNLDKLITLKQRKLDKLKIVKKSMQEKMFPREGTTVPEIRFQGFSGEWERKTLGDLGKVATNKRIFIHQTSSTGDVPFYKIGTFGKQPKLFISQELYETYKELFPYPEKGDLLFSVIGSIGRVVEYEGKSEYFQDSNIVWLQHNGAIVNAFLKQFYSIVKWSGLEGSTIKHLYNKNILETKIQHPCQKEQTKIGTYFKKLDKLISLQQKEIEKLKQIKSSCLSKMFV